MNIIDALSAGLNTVLKKIWLLIVPILLSLLLWQGPQLSVAPLLAQMAEDITALHAEIAALPNVDQETLKSLEALAAFSQEMSTSAVANANLAVLIEAFAVRVPVLVITSLPPEDTPNRLSIEIGSQGAFWLTCLLLLPLGTAIAALYLTMAARGINQDAPPQPFLRRLLRNWLYIMLMVFLLVAVIILIGLPTILIILLIGIVLPAVVPLMTSIMIMTLLWMGFYAVFTLDALFVNDVNPLQAIWHSINIIHRNFWSAVGLLILSNVISLGLTVVWDLISVNTIGAVAAIVGNAYIGTGLVLASFIFYQDRCALWQKEIAEKQKAQ